MKRATITFPDDLERKLESYYAQQPAPPSLSKLVQVALDEYLENLMWQERGLRARRGSLSVTPAEKGSGKNDVSERHDHYLAEQE